MRIISYGPSVYEIKYEDDDGSYYSEVFYSEKDYQDALRKLERKDREGFYDLPFKEKISRVYRKLKFNDDLNYPEIMFIKEIESLFNLQMRCVADEYKGYGSEHIEIDINGDPWVIWMDILTKKMELLFAYGTCTDADVIRLKQKYGETDV